LQNRPPSLRAIAAFEAVARHGSFRKAADELSLTPSALSHAVKALERRLNQRLFNRTAKGAMLTESGISLLTRVRLSLGLLNDAFDSNPARHRERLVISALPSIARKIIVPRLQGLRDALPSVDIELHATTAVESVEGEVDVGIRFGPGGWRGVETSFVAAERHVVVANPRCWPGAPPASPDELKGCDLLHDRESSWRLWLREGGFDPEDFGGGITITDSALIIDAAVAGMGVALARAQLCREELADGRLVRLFERAQPSKSHYWTVWNGSSPKRELIYRFTAWLTRQFPRD
jgi:LysR family glycine cleavage system transcriptional activator